MEYIQRVGGPDGCDVGSLRTDAVRLVAGRQAAVMSPWPLGSSSTAVWQADPRRTLSCGPPSTIAAIVAVAAAVAAAAAVAYLNLCTMSIHINTTDGLMLLPVPNNKETTRSHGARRNFVFELGVFSTRNKMAIVLDRFYVRFVDPNVTPYLNRLIVLSLLCSEVPDEY